MSALPGGIFHAAKSPAMSVAAEPSILSLALELAANGLPVFPCGDDKKPVSKHGFLDATKDPAIIRKMFANPAATKIGVPTGEASGIDVLDFDYRHGAKNWEDANIARLPETRIHETMSGGRHMLFRFDERVRNSASRVGPGVDVRGGGGYVIWSGSPGYSVVSDAPVAPWPEFLLVAGMALPSPPKERPISSAGPYVAASDKRIEAYLQSVLNTVRTAAEGQKHTRLRNAALALGGIQAEVGFSDAEAVGWMMEALPPSVADWKAAAKTAAWALAAGRDAPFTLPDRPNPKSTRPSDPTTGADDGRATGSQRHATDAPATPKTRLPLTWTRDIAPIIDAQGTLVEALLDTGAMSVVYGASNAGKTFFCLNMAFHIATGLSWFGREITGHGCVVYVAAEGGKGILNRVAALKQHTGLVDVPLAVIACPVDMLNPEADLPTLLDRIDEAAASTGLPCAMVVIDTLSRAMQGGDENGPKDMTAFVANCDQLRHAGPHLMVVHHCGKDEAKGARGHSSLRAATDTEIELKVIDAADKTATAYVRKQRDMAGDDVMAFKILPVTLGMTSKGQPVTSCVIEPNEKTESGKKAAGNETDAKLRPAAVAQYKALHDAMVVSRTPGSVSRAEWYSECVRLGLSEAIPADAPYREKDAKQKLFRSYISMLKVAGWIGVDGETVTDLRGGQVDGQILATFHP